MIDIEKLRTFFLKDRYAMFSQIMIEQVTEEETICSMNIEDMHLNAGDLIQGGAIFTLADFAFAVAANARGKMTVSLDSHITFIKAGKGKKLIAKAKPVSLGNKIVTYQIDVFDEQDERISMMTVNGYQKETVLSL